MKHPPRILVVDDSAAMRSALAKTLRSLSPNLDQAENGLIGLESARKAPYDLIITDVDMPVMDGFSFCKALKTSPKANGIPVSLSSA